MESGLKMLAHGKDEKDQIYKKRAISAFINQPAWRCGRWTRDKVINREIKVLVGRDVILFGSHCSGGQNEN